jgi:hypothetical protein
MLRVVARRSLAGPRYVEVIRREKPDPFRRVAHCWPSRPPHCPPPYCPWILCLLVFRASRRSEADKAVAAGPNGRPAAAWFASAGALTADAPIDPHFIRATRRQGITRTVPVGPGHCPHPQRRRCRPNELRASSGSGPDSGRACFQPYAVRRRTLRVGRRTLRALQRWRSRRARLPPDVPEVRGPGLSVRFRVTGGLPSPAAGGRTDDDIALRTVRCGPEEDRCTGFRVCGGPVPARAARGAVHR